MPLEELFVPNMPQLYIAGAQLPENQLDFKDNLRENMLATLQLHFQFQIRSKLSTWLHRPAGKAAAMRFAQTATARLGLVCRSRFRGKRGDGRLPKT